MQMNTLECRSQGFPGLRKCTILVESRCKVWAVGASLLTQDATRQTHLALCHHSANSLNFRSQADNVGRVCLSLRMSKSASVSGVAAGPLGWGGEEHLSAYASGSRSAPRSAAMCGRRRGLSAASSRCSLMHWCASSRTIERCPRSTSLGARLPRRPRRAPDVHREGYGASAKDRCL